MKVTTIVRDNCKMCRTVCLTDLSNDQLVKDEGAQIFYSIRLQTEPFSIGANCEIPHKMHPTIDSINFIWKR